MSRFLLTSLFCLNLVPMTYIASSWMGSELPTSSSAAPTPEEVVSEPITISYEKLDDLYFLISLEPTARDIQHQVILYSNTSNKKIEGWQIQSRMRALLPTLSFGRDGSKSNNIDLDRGSTSTPDRYIAGPEDLSEGWDFDVSWDLGDILWSSSQTSIDSRNNLMVDIRHELLREANMLYHSRRKLQKDIVLEPASDQKDYLDRIILLEEQTALLDGMTNGYLKHRLKLIYGEHPWLENLWSYSPDALLSRSSLS